MNKPAELAMDGLGKYITIFQRMKRVYGARNKKILFII